MKIWTKEKSLIFSVFTLLVATSKTQHFNPWLYPWSCFILGAAFDLKFYVMMAKKLKRLILKSERNHSMFVEARWQEMKPWYNSGLMAEKPTMFDFSRYFHFRKHSPHVVGNIDPRFSEKPLKFPNHYSIKLQINSSTQGGAGSWVMLWVEMLSFWCSN